MPVCYHDLLQNKEEKKLWKAGAYLRVSREDGKERESDSIDSQRKVIRSYLKKEADICLVREWIDDGVSGIRFDREGFEQMLCAIRQGRINCVLVKDLSRFGRDYIQTGYYIQHFFPQNRIRFIAISERYDSIQVDFWERNLYLPILNILNDGYCQDISQKVRLGQESKRKEGAYTGAFCVYGYQKNEKDHNVLEIDSQAAMMIRKIFEWRIQRHSAEKIANYLNQLAVPSPYRYKQLRQEAFYTDFAQKEILLWSPTAVRRVLHNKMYAGYLQQGKSKKINYKLADRMLLPKEQWIEQKKEELGIISEDIYWQVQQPISNRGEFDV